MIKIIFFFISAHLFLDLISKSKEERHETTASKDDLLENKIIIQNQNGLKILTT